MSNTHTPVVSAEAALALRVLWDGIAAPASPTNLAAFACVGAFIAQHANAGAGTWRELAELPNELNGDVITYSRIKSAQATHTDTIRECMRAALRDGEYCFYLYWMPMPAAPAGADWRDSLESRPPRIDTMERDAARWNHARHHALTELLSAYPTTDTSDVGLDYAVDVAIEAGLSKESAR